MANTYSADLGTSNTTKYLSIADNVGITGGNITLSCWIKVRTAPSSSVYALFTQSSVTNNIVYKLDYRDTSGTKTINFSRVKNGVAAQTTTYTVDLGTTDWKMLVGTYDGSDLRLYLNGSLVAGPTSASGNGSVSPGNNLYVGANNAASELSSVYIDDCRVFNVARDAASIGTDYSAPNEISGGTSNLVAYYKFNSDLTTDATSNAYNLTNTGTVTQSSDVPFPGSTDYVVDATTSSFTLTTVNAIINTALIIVTSSTSYTLSTVNTIIGYGLNLVLSVVQYILTGGDTEITMTGWTNQNKNSSIWSNSSKNTSSYSNQSKNSNSWTNNTKH